MARKPCADTVANLVIDCSSECLNVVNPRIARNAILPFYYDNSVVPPKKVFYIKNPAYYAGTAANNPASLVTQAMHYSRLANRVTTGQKRTTVFLPAPIIQLPRLFNRLP
jgi:hypothetical protein